MVYMLTVQSTGCCSSPASLDFYVLFSANSRVWNNPEFIIASLLRQSLLLTGIDCPVSLKKAETSLNLRVLVSYALETKGMFNRDAPQLSRESRGNSRGALKAIGFFLIPRLPDGLCMQVMCLPFLPHHCESLRDLSMAITSNDTIPNSVFFRSLFYAVGATLHNTTLHTTATLPISSTTFLCYTLCTFEVDDSQLERRIGEPTTIFPVLINTLKNLVSEAPTESDWHILEEYNRAT